MKKLFIFFFFCFFELGASEARSLIVFFDWDTERINQDLDKIIYSSDALQNGWGPVTGNLITALVQKAAPIIVTSSLWHNFVARRKLFKDFLEGRGAVYKDKYVRFKNDATIKQFQKYIQAYFQPNGEKVLGKFDDPIRHELDSYFLCYITPFEEKDWMLKKVSDYIYILIPQVYMTQLRSKPLPKTERNFAVSLKDDDLRLGLKIDAMTTMSYQDALNPDKHKITLESELLLKDKDATIFKTLRMGYYINPPEGIIISKHLIRLLEDIFVTKKDLAVKNDLEKTELNYAVYLHKWLIYLNGHGSLSNPATLKEMNIEGIIRRIEFTYLAGIELYTFREWLFFLNSSIKTEFLFYESCYSGGEHLQRPYEYQWDYLVKKVESKPDIFNYMIVAGNLAYTTTTANMPFAEPPFKKASIQTIRVDYPIQFTSFFKAAEKYFAIGHIVIGDKKTYFDILKKLNAQKAKFASIVARTLSANIFEVMKEIENLQKKLEDLHFITLNTVIDYVHNVAEHRPAVRYPGTDFFIPLPLDENKQIAERIRFETTEEKQTRKKEEERIKKVVQQQAQKHIQKQKEQPKEPKKPAVSISENALIKAVRILKQKLVQLKNNISKFKF